MEAAALRISEHAASHRLSRVRVVLHGGEPLLLGPARMADLLSALDARLAPVTRADIRIHTNGVLLSERWCDLFDKYGVKVGVSLDGDGPANDRHRRFADGRSSYAQVLRALVLLRRAEYQHLFAGILCTIDVRNDPIAVYEALVAEHPPRLDLLLPHATWDDPPVRPEGLSEPYASWLLRIYRRWVADGRPVPIRIFESLTSAASGGPSWSEAVGLDPVDLAVIETDGDFEEPDSLKVAYHGAPSTGLNVFANTVDQVAHRPGFAVRRGGLAALSATCQACEVVQICGGGHYAHRYSRDNGFDNPSVYCADLKALIKQMVPRGKGSPSPAAAPPVHSIPDVAFDMLASGPGSAAAMNSLAGIQLSLTRALVAAVASGDYNWKNGELRQAAMEGWALLCALDGKYPAAVQEIFSHPFTRAWAVRCLSPTSESDSDLDRAHLAGLAAAAAFRAGVTAALPVPVRYGAVTLPTVGTLRMTVSSERTAIVSVSARELAATGVQGKWHFLPGLSYGNRRVAIEVLDPFRDIAGWSVARQVSAQDLRTWRQCLTASGLRLLTALPAYAEVLGAGLGSVVPLSPAATSDRAATTRHAFGAVALALPRDLGTVDELLLHEFQHVKLNALIDLYELFDRTDAGRLRVPWRADPRPVEGVLHGIYAHLALAHLWQTRGEPGRATYLRYQAWVCEGSTALAATGSLTSDGERFVAGMYAAAQG